MYFHAQQSSLASSKPDAFPIEIPSRPRVFDRDGVCLVVYQRQRRATQRCRTIVADTTTRVTDKGRSLFGRVAFLSLVSVEVNSFALESRIYEMQT
jgi:hypothetical protein